MTDRELMQMALDALEAQFYTDGRTIKALRDRLSQFELEPVAIGEEWKPCMKLPIVVHVREQRKSETHVSTREGITPVKEDDLIMRGVAGEEYPIGRELFNRTYTFNTAPPKREWVGLTDGEIVDLLKECEGRLWADGFRALEAKLKEKNEQQN